MFRVFASQMRASTVPLVGRFSASGAPRLQQGQRSQNNQNGQREHSSRSRTAFVALGGAAVGVAAGIALTCATNGDSPWAQLATARAADTERIAVVATNPVVVEPVVVTKQPVTEKSVVKKFNIFQPRVLSVWYRGILLIVSIASGEMLLEAAARVD
jgi:hypothetical protein